VVRNLLSCCATIKNKLTRKAQTTIPTPVRAALRLVQGDERVYTNDGNRVAPIEARGEPSDEFRSVASSGAFACTRVPPPERGPCTRSGGSPGKSGLAISASSRASNNDSCKGPILAGELLDREGRERGDPVETGRLEVVPEARIGDHPAIADHHHAAETKRCWGLPI
jgi:antitoxin PrlF